MIKFNKDLLDKMFNFFKKIYAYLNEEIGKVNPNIMKKVTKCLAYAKGKKTTAAAIIALFITYALSKQYIDADMAILLNGILVAAGLGANYATTKLVK